MKREADNYKAENGDGREVIRRTWSVCPVCFKRIPARQVRQGNQVFLEKECPEHGAFSAVVWRGEDLEEWRKGWPAQAEEPEGCPDNCGLCREHLQQTCCVLLEVTGRCNLRCPHCFAEGKIDGGGELLEADPPIETVKAWIDDIVSRGPSLIQFSGGEPTVREDLPELIAYAKAAGSKYVQLNSNGIRLGEDPDYVKTLAKAGLDFVFLQFDGLEDGIYEKLRGRPLTKLKQKAIVHCGEQKIGVTLVPMVVPGVNEHQTGAIVEYGLALSPVVRGVHFQPVSYFGRYETPPADEERITLPEVLKAIEEQTEGRVKKEFFAASCCDHPMCGFHGAFLALPEGLRPMTQKRDCCTPVTAEQNREFVGRRWKREETPETECCCGEASSAEDSCCCGEASPAGEPCCCEPAPAAQGECCCGETSPAEDSCCCEPAPAVQEESCCCGAPDPRDIYTGEASGFDEFLRLVQTYSFTITAMAFQDAYTLDLERLRNCSLHVYREGRMVPFCSRYLPR
ncbi:MAG: radical SAM protein [Bacillota bacterium]|nr:radical SAM protein [Bacillota bacterium]